MRIRFKATEHLVEYHGFPDKVKTDFRDGDIRDLTEPGALYLLAAFPANFTLLEPEAEPEAEAFDAPPLDKMIRRAKKKIQEANHG